MPTPIFTYFHWAKVATRYYLRARTRYDVHSPFLSEWVAAVLEDQRHFYAFDEVEDIRDYWSGVRQQITFAEDLGAGSRAGQGSSRSVAQLAQQSGVEPAVGRLLFRLVQHAKPRKILELGTSLGLSALYIRSAARGAHFVTIEGQATVARLAQQSFARTNLPLPDFRIGTFAEQLPSALQDLTKVDFAWLDGDHRGAATLAYFEQLAPHLHNNSIVVIGDIHWSTDMEAAWATLQQHPRVTLSVDVFQFGVLFFRQEQQQTEHFTLIPARFKPWRMGFFR